MATPCHQEQQRDKRDKAGGAGVCGRVRGEGMCAGGRFQGLGVKGLAHLTGV